MNTIGFFKRFIPTTVTQVSLLLLASALPCLGTADYGPAVDRMITGCTKWYTSGYNHKFCVVHDMEGYYLTGISYLRRCDVQSSCHYVISGKSDYSGDAPAGELSQLVREAYYAWHARCWNQHSLGAEHEGFASNPAWYTDAMYQSSALLYRHWCDKFGIPKDRNHIVAHGQKSVPGWPSWASANLGIDPYCNDHTDPGPYWDWTKYMNLIGGATDNAAFVSKTISDGTSFAPGQAFSCTFVMRNSGSTTWIAAGGDGYTFNNNGGTAMGAPFATHLTGNVSPGNNASFTVNFTAPTTPGSYAATFRMNSSSYTYFGAEASISIKVAVPVPVITSQPAAITKNAGETASFSVTASGATSYQWKKNGVNLSNGGRISGATSATLGISSVQLSDAGFYSVAVANTGGSITSSEAQLVIATTPAVVGAGTGLRGMYYNNTDLSALGLSRVDSTINFDWATSSPGTGIAADTFSVSWTGEVEPRYSQTYTFYTRSDDGLRLWVNGVLLIDKWVDQGATEWSGAIALTAGQKYSLRMDYYEQTGAASARLSWSSASQAKQVIPATQLYRPPIVLAATGAKSVAENATLNFTLIPSSYDQVAGVTAFEDFESYEDGSPSDIVMFRKPGNSSTTSGFLDSAITNYTASTSGFPSGRGGSRALKAYWSFLTGTSNPWLRLTTYNTQNRPNPIINTSESLWFDVRCDKAIKVALGIRETNPTGAIGENGGVTGSIEFVGAPSRDGRPEPTRTVAANTWTTLKFDLPAEPCVGFTGNGILESTTGKGVLEHIAIVPAGATSAHTLYLDNFTVIQNVNLTWSLEPGAPAGATINPSTGEFSWKPGPGQGPATYNVIVRATDNGSSQRTATLTIPITVNAAPIIAAQPLDHTVSPGANVTFGATVTGTSPLAYQWYSEGAPIPTATASTYTIQNVQSSDAGAYHLVVTNLYGSAQSTQVMLTVSLENSPPSITSQPSGLVVNEGQNAEFCVTVVGTSPLAYQWLHNHQPIPGATQRCYQLVAQAADAGVYALVVSNEFGSETSAEAVLAVNTAPEITLQPQPAVVDIGQPASFSVSATGTAPLSYQWRKNGAPISGATTSTLSFTSAQGSDAAAYSVVISNMAGQKTSGNANLTVNLPPSINTHPAGQDVSPGANLTLSVGASGASPLSYQWRKNGAPIANATTSSLSLNNIQAASAGAYSVIVSNRLGTATSLDALVTLNAVVIFADSFESGMGQWSLAGSAISASTTQNHTSGGSTSAQVDVSSDKMYHNLGLNLEGRVRLTFWAYDETPNTVNSGQNRWFGELRAYSGGAYTNGSLQQLYAIGRYGVNFGTGTGTLASQVLNTTNYHARVFSGANSGFLNLSVQRSPGWHKFEIERLENGTTVRFYVDGVLGATVTDSTYAKLNTVSIGSVAAGTTAANMWIDDVKVEYFDPPTILTQPITQTMEVNGSATFSVVATNNAFNYQWRRNGESLANGAGIAGVSSPSLTISGITGDNAGDYTVVVWNGAGPIVSTTARLRVPPFIAGQPVARTNLPGTTATFSVSADGQAPLQFQWRKDGAPLSDGPEIFGAQTATLTLGSVAETDQGAYSVFITNAAGSLESQPAALTVVEQPAITLHPASQALAAGSSVLLTADASGSAPLAFQWYFNGTPMPGRTTKSLLLDPVQPADAGEYTIEATNPAGSALSDPAVIAVNSKPVIAPVPNAIVHAGMTVIITNTATDLEAPPQTLNFTIESGPASAIMNPETGVFMWITSAEDANTTNTVSLRVMDNGTPPQQDTASFSLVVVDIPTILSAEVHTNHIIVTWTSVAGMTYGIQMKDNLTDESWADLVDVVAEDDTTSLADPIETPYGLVPQRFFRIVVRE